VLLDLLRDVRVEAGRSQDELAARLKTSQGTVSKIESGERDINPLECAAWAEACNITARNFFNRLATGLERKV
jgi:transcriptional regulator with XRE-family HTH domain